MALFSHTNKLKIPEIADAETKPPENHQDNGATMLVNTQTSPPHSLPEDTSVVSVDFLPCPRVKVGDAAIQAREGDLLDVRLLVFDNIIILRLPGLGAPKSRIPPGCRNRGRR